MREASFLIAVALCLAGCPSPSNQDAGDVTAMDTNAPDDGASDGAVMDVIMVRYGSCGMRTYSCLCGCAPDAGQCQGGCISSNMACRSCYLNAVMTCCPSEYQGYSNCVAAAITPDDSGMAMCNSSDFVCIQNACSVPGHALDVCTAQPTCTPRIGACLGSWPTTCGM